MPSVVGFTELVGLRGVDLGRTDWLEVSRTRLEEFADAIGEPPAREFLALSLTVPLWERLVEVRGVSTRINYGVEWARFGPPVAIGARLRLAATVVEVATVPGGFQLTVDATIEVRGEERPAVVARTLKRYLA